MFLKGTHSRSIRELEKEVENMGGHLNGYTGRENTSVYMKVMARDVAKAVEILADVVQDSKFHEWLIKPTRKDILREIEEVAKDPEEVIFDHLHATAFQHTPLRRTILGPAENIQNITKKDMHYYMATHFTPHRMVISASGAVKHEDLVEQVKKLFTKLSANPLTTMHSHFTPHRMVISASGAVKHEDLVEQVKKLFTKLSANPLTTTQLVEKEPAIFTGSEIRMRDDNVPLAHFAVAFNGASSTDPDSVALMVMQEMLGSWKKSSGAGKHMGSQLAQLVGISELAERMMTFNTNYKDTGLFGVYAVAKPDCLDDLAFAIMQEISKLCYRVNDEDVIRAQNQLKSSLLLNLDGSFHTADEIGRQLISYGRRIPFIEMFARIDAVDAATIKRVANRFIFDQDIAIAASGPVKLLPDYNWFRRRTYMLRY